MIFNAYHHGRTGAGQGVRHSFTQYMAVCSHSIPGVPTGYARFAMKAPLSICFPLMSVGLPHVSFPLFDGLSERVFPEQTYS